MTPWTSVRCLGRSLGTLPTTAKMSMAEMPQRASKYSRSLLAGAKKKREKNKKARRRDQSL